MKNKIILITTMMLSSHLVWAGTSLLEAAGKQLVKDKATVVAPDAVKTVGAANETLHNAKQVKEAIETAPATTTQQAESAVTNAAEAEVKSAVPSEATQAIDAVESGKSTIEAAPKSTDEAAEAVTNKAAEKTLDLLK